MVALLTVLVATAAVVARPAPSVEPLLSRADLRPDLVADGPPVPGDLALAWEHGITRGAVVPSFWSGPADLGSGVAQVGPASAVDTATGDLVGVLPGLTAPDGTRLVQAGDAMLEVDPRSGEVLRRRSLPLVDGGVPVVLEALDGAVLAGVLPRDDREGFSTLVVLDDRLEEVLRLSPAAPWRVLARRWLVVPDRLLAPTRPGSGPVLGPDDELDDPHLVVDARDGREVARLPVRPDGAAALVGERLVMELEGSLVDVLARGGPRDLERGEVDVVGPLGDRVVVSLRPEDGTIALGLLDPDDPGEVELLGRVRRDALPDLRGGGPSAVALRGDDLVTVREGELTAYDVEGDVRWRATVPGAELAVLVDGHVVVGDDPRLFSPGEPGASVVVLRLADGQRVVTVPPPRRAVAPVVAADGAVLVGLASVGADPGPRDEFAPWLDAVTGDAVDPLPGGGGQGARMPLVGMVRRDGRSVAVRWSDDPDRPQGALRVGDDEPVGVAAPVEGRRWWRASGVVGEHVLAATLGPDGAAAATPGLALVLLDGGAVVQVDLPEGAWSAAVDGGTAVLFARDRVALLEAPPAGVDAVTPLWVVDSAVPLPSRSVLERATDVDVAVTDDAVVLANADRVEVRERADGRLRHAFGGDRVLAGVHVLGDVVVLRAANGTAVAHGLDDGRVRWRADGLPGAVSSTAVVGDHLLLGTADGQVVEVDADGAELRRVEVGQGAVTGIGLVDVTLVVGVDGVLRGFRTDGTGAGGGDGVEVPSLP